MHHNFLRFAGFYLAIVGTLEAEKERRKSGLSSRVQFRNQGSEPKYTQELTLHRQKQKACMEETLWLQVRAADRWVSLKGTEVGFAVMCRFLPFTLATCYPGQSRALLWCSSMVLVPCIMVSLHTFQENIRDKLRPIPITASVEIQEPSTRRRVNSLPEVLPILNSNEPKSVHTDVSLPFMFANIFVVLFL